MENVLKTLKDKKANIKIIIDNLVARIKTLLDIIIVTLQDGRESDQKDLSSHDNNITLLLNKGKAKSNKS